MLPEFRTRAGRGVGRNHARKSSPRVEGLEQRLLLFATSGGQWAYGNRITYSFMPDGTSIGGTPSALFQSLNAKFSTSTWEQQFEKAAAVWEAVAGINLAQVPDDGTPVGANGNQQDDPRFGDIRIGGMSQQAGQLGFAYATPPFNGGTLAGDFFLNTDQPWQVNGTAYDLETVAIHEMGHALGMSHSAISSAVMYAYYNGTKQSLTADDVVGIQSIYGPRPLDMFQTAQLNNSPSTAANITPFTNGQGQIALANLNLSAATGSDWYFVTAPPTTTGSMTVTVQSSNLSSLSPAVLVYDGSLQLQGRASAPRSYGATVSVPVGGVTSGRGYYIKVVGADLGASGQGTFGLQVNFGSSPMSPIAPPNTVVTQQPDQGGGSSTLDTSVGASVGDITSLIGGWLGSLSPSLAHAVDAGLHNIAVGTVSGLGDELTIRDVTPGHAHRPVTMPRGPHSHASGWQASHRPTRHPKIHSGSLPTGQEGAPGIQASRHVASGLGPAAVLDRALRDWNGRFQG